MRYPASTTNNTPTADVDISLRGNKNSSGTPGVRDVQRGGLAHPLLLAVAAGSITIIRVPWLIGYTPTKALVALVPIVFACIWMNAQHKSASYRPLVALTGVYVLILTVALWRGKSAGMSTKEVVAEAGAVAAMAWFALLLVRTAPTQRWLWWRLLALALAPATYVLANLLLHFAGFSQTAPDPDLVSATGQAQLLHLIGINVGRTAFPLNPSVNGVGLIAGVGLVSAAMIAIRLDGKVERRLGIAGAVVCLVCVLMTDTRTSFVLAIGVIAFLLFVKRTRLALILGLIVPFSFLIVEWGLKLIAATPVVGILSRNPTDFATGNGRSIIWHAVLNTFGTGGVFHQLFGWGANGQFTSGASLHYAYLFAINQSPAFVPAHNLALQTLLDTGLVGLGFLIVLIVVTASRLEAINRLSPKSPVAGLLAGFIMLCVGGATEISPTYRTQECLLFITILFATTAGLALKPVEVPASVLPRINWQREKRLAPSPALLAGPRRR